MQNFSKTLRSRAFWLGKVLPFVLAVAAAFVARYQLELSDGADAQYVTVQAEHLPEVVFAPAG